MAKFEKGVSGNPGGRPKEVGELRELARSRTHQAMNTLLAVMDDKNAPASARVTAACAVLDRGFGRPSQAMQLDMDVTQETVIAPDPVLLVRELLFLAARLKADGDNPQLRD